MTEFGNGFSQGGPSFGAGAGHDAAGSGSGAGDGPGSGLAPPPLPSVEWGEDTYERWRADLKAKGGAPRLGVDTGGTFTDFARLEDGRVTIEKRPSMPADPGRPIREALEAADAGAIFLGTTVGTNAVLERKGARTVLVTTAGFEDLLDLARQERPRLYELEQSVPPPLVPRDLRIGAGERITAEGAVESGLDEARLRDIVNRVTAAAPESVAVLLLHACRNDDHERRIAAAIGKALPGVPVSISSRVLSERREYERLVATVVNAFLGPVYGRFLARIGGERPLALSLSSGGVTPAEIAGEWPVRTLLSGPAAGVTAAHRLAHSLSTGPLLTLDMGGTSTDTAWVDPSGDAMPLTTSGRIGDLPVAFPSLDVVTVGAGGGSIARLDAAGALTVGPESAGADPGPAAYGAGTELTITDCALILGLLPPEIPLASGLRADLERAREAAGRLAMRLEVTVEDVASAAINVALSHMERALRRASSARGHAPERAALLAYGGAGGLFAAQLSRRLGMSRVLIPPAPGVFSAWGTLASPPCLDWGQSVQIRASEFDEASPYFAFWERLGHFVPALPGESGFHCALGVRYPGQAHELLIPAGPDWIARFHDHHERVTGYARRDTPPLVGTLRVRRTSVEPPPPLPSAGPPEADPGPARPVIFSGRPQPTPVIRRDRLPAEAQAGPLLVVEQGSVTVVPPGFRVERRDGGVLVVS